MKIPLTGIKLDIIPGYQAHKRMPSRASRVLDLERGPNWFVARIGNLALKVWRHA